MLSCVRQGMGCNHGRMLSCIKQGVGCRNLDVGELPNTQCPLCDWKARPNFYLMQRPLAKSSFFSMWQLHTFSVSRFFIIFISKLFCFELRTNYIQVWIFAVSFIQWTEKPDWHGAGLHTSNASMHRTPCTMHQSCTEKKANHWQRSLI